MNSIMPEIKYDMEVIYQTIAFLHRKIDEILKKLTDEIHSLERAELEYYRGVDILRQIDQEITQQYNAAVGLAETRVGFDVNSSMLDRNDFAQPFAAEVQALFDKLERDKNLIKKHLANIHMYNAKRTLLEKELQKFFGEHKSMAVLYRKFEQRVAQKIEGLEKEKEEL